jgi:hypothetical protein
LGPIRGETGARFDPTRLTWLGTLSTDTGICVALNSPQVRVKTLKDLYEKELVVGNSGVGTLAYYLPKALNALTGLKFKIVSGFPSVTSVLLAMDRGEVEGICGANLDNICSQRPDWIPNKKVTVLFQVRSVPNPALKDVPVVGDLAKNPDDKAIIEFLTAGLGLGRPFIAPPGIAPERAKMLQDAFMATMQDPEFLADAAKQKLEVEPKDSAYLAALIRKIYGTPKPVVDKVVGLMK